MVWRDLDVCVAADGLDRAGAWTLVEPFVLAADRVCYEHLEEPDDRRHYFVLRRCGWKLDLSLFTAGNPPQVQAYQDDHHARLEDGTRLTILTLKELWHRRPEYPELVGGYEICAAVLVGVRTNGELAAHLRQRGLLTAPSA